MVYPWSPLGPRWLSKDGSHQNFQATSSTLEHTNHMQNIPLASRVSSLPFGGSEYAERNIPQAPSLPFAGHDRITSIFPRWTHRHAKPDQQTWENATDTKTTRSSAGLCLQAPHYETKRTKVMMDTWGYKEVSSLGEQPSLRDDLVQPLDPKLAVIKDSYDPNTIARDVLIVANQHPTENCLNHHLIGLRRNIPAVKYSSDLESLRWDMIDPETPTSSVTANSTPPRLSSSMEQKVNIETHVLPDIIHSLSG
ncbi:hypothetical protein N7466_008387 [Penicillium verhagenii]|uniref:uncharacterized protein n=1 Tax=Penicillium verhagenii TaxID=1562060 RepID=UPI0025456929|nr:uncharacterized protein N7466_008387 [Penicillium verhagenii]KAJ5924200.1 hypothetical protein N7466_008387 [Penicillium verhagenii]